MCIHNVHVPVCVDRIDHKALGKLVGLPSLVIGKPQSVPDILRAQTVKIHCN